MSDTAHSSHSTRFADLGLPSELTENLSSLGYHQMTPIQAQSLPHTLAGRDLLGQGKTGSGKTAAFGLAILGQLQVERFRVQSLILCPTRELADQVAEELRRLARQMHNVKILTLCGGAPLGPQIHSLSHGAHIIVGTPGRVEQHLNKGTLSLKNLTVLVLDEADRMLDMGFQESLDAIIEATPSQRQTLLFSATFDDTIRPLAEAKLRQPITVSVESVHDQATIQQHFYSVDGQDSRLEALIQLLLQVQPQSSVVFCNTRQDTQQVADALADKGFSAQALHGDMEQRERDQTLIRFAQQSLSILVATDVAARGLDISDLDAVFNYELPRDLDVHIHRIGRTGRAGSHGAAYTLVGPKESFKMAALEDRLNESLSTEPLPRANRQAQPFHAPMMTLEVDAGKKQKIRPGDLVGALTNSDYGHALNFEQLGKIKVTARSTFVAVARQVAKKALTQLQQAPLKGRKVRARLLK